MATHSKLSLSVRAVVAFVALALWACSSSGSNEDTGDGSEGHLNGAQAGSASVAGKSGVAEATGGATEPDAQGSGDTGSVGVEPDPEDEGDEQGQGGSPTEPDEGAGGAAGETPVEVEPPAPSEAFLRGEALVADNQCATCHQRNFAGFTVFPNITPDVKTGIGAWTDAQIVAAIREGVAADGASLCATMQRYSFSDEQASDVVAFLRGVSAVSNRVASVCPGHGQ